MQFEKLLVYLGLIPKFLKTEVLVYYIYCCIGRFAPIANMFCISNSNLSKVYGSSIFVLRNRRTPGKPQKKGRKKEIHELQAVQRNSSIVFTSSVLRLNVL